MKLKNIKNKLIRRYYFWKVRKNLLSKYREEYEIHNILEKWIAARILSGRSDRREELNEKQALIKETEEFMGFLKRLKKL